MKPHLWSRVLVTEAHCKHLTMKLKSKDATDEYILWRQFFIVLVHSTFQGCIYCSSGQSYLELKMVFTAQPIKSFWCC